MKFGQKYVMPPFIALFWFALGGAAVLISDIIVSLLYDYGTEILPSIFLRPSPISEPELYERVQTVTTLSIIALTLWPMSYLAARLDNKRFEFTVKETEGLYRIGTRLKAHMRLFWLSDLISTALAAAIFTLPAYLIPEKYLDPFLPFLWCGGRLLGHFELVPALLIIISMSCIIRLLVTPSVLKAWRVGWLTGSID